MTSSDRKSKAAPLARRFYPESNIGGFSHADSGIALYTQLNAILKPTDRVLDFGAGRGHHILDNAIEYRRKLFDLRGRCAHIEGCDIDDAVLTNPFVDHATVVDAGHMLPFADESFDLVVSRFVFEHIDVPGEVATELLRILKPGGVIAALTPNKFGYIALAASAVPNHLHTWALRYIQPKRKVVDVFPTRYRLNSRRDLERHFGNDAEVFTQYFSAEPAYHFGRPAFYRMIKWLNKHLPASLAPLIIVYIRKNVD
jgi:SAM-dependent methyltransferase